MINTKIKVILLSSWLTYGHTMDVNLQINSADINTIQQHYNHYVTISEQHKLTGLDVHQFNAQIQMRQVLIDLRNFDNSYIHSEPNSHIDVLISSIYSTPEFENLTDKEKQSVQYNINMLKNHITRNPIEPSETGTNVQELLSRIWSLSNFPENRSSGNFFSTSSAAITFLLNVLKENSETGGGCYQGFAGRLGAMYLMLINSWIVE